MTRNFVYGYAPRINQKKRFKNSIVTINDIGLRSVHNWKKMKKNKNNFFGDSVTYGGSYIDDKETFSHLTCEYLNDINYLCGNAGVNAYGIHNIVYRSRYDERISDDDLRIFLLVPDDFYRGLQNHNTAHFYMKENNFLFPAIFEAVNFISSKYNIKFIYLKVQIIKMKNKKRIINESVLIFKF